MNIKTYDRNAIKKRYDAFYKSSDFRSFSLSEKFFIKSMISKFNIKPGSKILDLGCGTGKYTHLFNQFGMDCLGVDMSREGIQKAKIRSPNSKFIVGDVTNMSFNDNSFDVLFCSGLSLFNETDLRALTPFTRSILKYLKNGGLFVFIKTSRLTDKLSKNHTRLDYSIESFMSFFKKINELTTVAVTGTYPQIFILLRNYGFSKIPTVFSVLNTKLTRVGLKICIVFKKTSSLDKDNE